MRILKFIRSCFKAFLVIMIVITGGILVYRYWWIPELKKTLYRVKDIDSIKYVYIDSTKDGISLKKEVWKKGEGDEMKIRIDEDYLGDGQKERIYLFDFKERVAYSYYFKDNKARKSIIKTSPSDNYADGTKNELLYEADWITERHPILLGKENLDGKESLVVFCFDDDIKVKEWILEEYGVRIKGKELFGQEEHKWRRENLEINIDISDDIFKLPPEAEIISEE